MHPGLVIVLAPQPIKLRGIYFSSGWARLTSLLAPEAEKTKGKVILVILSLKRDQFDILKLNSRKKF